jgi:CDP-paratose 2-epimerase
MREAIAICERIAGRELSWTLDGTPRVGDHRWWISDVRPFQSDYPGWRVERDVEAIVQEIHDANVEAWATSAS